PGPALMGFVLPPHWCHFHFPPGGAFLHRDETMVRIRTVVHLVLLESSRVLPQTGARDPKDHAAGTARCRTSTLDPLAALRARSSHRLRDLSVVTSVHCMDKTPVGGSHGNLHWTTGIHSHAWRRCRNVAAGCERAAAQAGEANWRADELCGQRSGRTVARGSLRKWTAEAGMDKGTKPQNRIPLG